MKINEYEHIKKIKHYGQSLLEAESLEEIRELQEEINSHFSVYERYKHEKKEVA